GFLEREQWKVGEHNDRELNMAINVAITVKLPVHINVPLEEPLYGTVKFPSIMPKVIPVRDDEVQGEPDWENFVQIWNSYSRKMVLVGTSPPNTVEQYFLDILANDGSVLVF